MKIVDVSIKSYMYISYEYSSLEELLAHELEMVNNGWLYECRHGSTITYFKAELQ